MVSRMCQVPQFPGLQHFSQVSNIKFADGNSFVAVMKVCSFLSSWCVCLHQQVILPVLVSLFPPVYRPVLKAIQTVALITMHASMKAQTPMRIKTGQGLVHKLNMQLPVRGMPEVDSDLTINHVGCH